MGTLTRLSAAGGRHLTVVSGIQLRVAVVGPIRGLFSGQVLRSLHLVYHRSYQILTAANLKPAGHLLHQMFF